MRKLIYLILILFFNSCSGQKALLDFKQKDIYVFNFVKKNIKSIPPKEKVSIRRASTSNNIDFNIELNTSEEIYNDKNNIIQTQKKETNINTNYFEKKFSFIKDKDTMNINCVCGQNRNYFFKKVKFIKGDFELHVNFPKKYNKLKKIYEEKIPYRFGKDIKASKELKALVFQEGKNEKTKIKFEKIKFIQLNLNDTANIKLKPL